MKNLLKLEEVAQLFSVSHMTVYRWAKSGLLPYYRLGKGIRFFSEEVEDFVNQRKVEKKIFKIVDF